MTAKREVDTAQLTVADDGTGIPKAKLEQALKRGGRLDASGAGTGLGLAIVADIAEACGATLSFDEDAPGLSVTLRLRLAGQKPASKV